MYVSGLKKKCLHVEKETFRTYQHLGNEKLDKFTLSKREEESLKKLENPPGSGNYEIPKAKPDEYGFFSLSYGCYVNPQTPEEWKQFWSGCYETPQITSSKLHLVPKNDPNLYFGKIYAMTKAKDTFDRLVWGISFDGMDPDKTVNEIKDHIPKLVKHPRAHFLVQLLLLHTSEAGIRTIQAMITRNFKSICNNKHGSDVVGTLLRALKVGKGMPLFVQQRQIEELLSLLKSNVLDLVKSVNGSRIAVLCVCLFPLQCAEAITEELHLLRSKEKHCLSSFEAVLLKLCKNKNSSPVVVQCLNSLRSDCTEPILKVVRSNWDELAKHPCSQNVIQAAGEKIAQNCQGRLLEQKV